LAKLIGRANNPGDDEQNSRPVAGIVEGAERQVSEPEDVPTLEGTALAGEAFQLDLASADEDEGVPPLVPVVGPLGAGPDRHGPDVEIGH
jgi:hypothetical protein